VDLFVGQEIEREARPMSVMLARDRWGNTEPPIPVDLQFWNPLQAELEFLDRFRKATA